MTDFSFSVIIALVLIKMQMYEKNEKHDNGLAKISLHRRIDE